MPPAIAARWTENRPTAGLRAIQLRELWAYRELVFFLALRDVKARYKQALFGFGWAVLQPVAGVAVFTFVFRGVADISSQGIPYPLFALVGFLAWTYFASCVSVGTTSLVENAALVTKVYFPRLAAPVSALLPGLVNLLPGFVVMVVLMTYYGVAPGPEVALLPVCLLAMMGGALGAGLLLATLNVRYRDVGSVIGTLMQMWLFASPVAYPSSAVPDDWQWLYAVNPMSGIIDSLRWSLLDAPAPGSELLISAASCVVLLVAGLLYFASAERRFADVI
jgi:ABC-type polysaccharide/polyol phosphate export permease